MPSSLNKVLLSNPNVALFTHHVAVEDEQTVRLFVETSHPGQLLETLQIIDTGGGSVRGVSLNQRLEWFVESDDDLEEPERLSLLEELMGRRVVLTLEGRRLEGVLLKVNNPRGGWNENQLLGLVLDDGVVKTFVIQDIEEISVPGDDRAPLRPGRPESSPAKDQTREAELLIKASGSGERTLIVSFAVPVSAWKMSYRLLLDEDRQSAKSALLKAHALVENPFRRPWENVDLSFSNKSRLPESSLAFRRSGQDRVANKPPSGVTVYKVPYPATVPAEGSGLLEVLDARVPCDSVLYYQHESDTNGLREGVLIENRADKTLAPGRAAVFCGGELLGECRLPELRPRERSLLCFRESDDCGVAYKERPEPPSLEKIVLYGFALKLLSSRIIHSDYEITNNTTRRKTLFIDHPRERGEELVTPRNPARIFSKAWRFKITAPPDISIRFELSRSRRAETIKDLYSFKKEDLPDLKKEMEITEEQEERILAILKIAEAMSAPPVYEGGSEGEEAPAGKGREPLSRQEGMEKIISLADYVEA